MQIYFYNRATFEYDYLGSPRSLRQCRRGSRSMLAQQPELVFRTIYQWPDFKGYLRASTKIVFDKVIVDLGWNEFSDTDIQAYRVLFDTIRKMLNSTLISDIVDGEVIPFDSVEETKAERITPGFHPVCTCRMGSCTDVIL